MALPLRQHTATTLWIGPFIAATDGFTRQASLLLTGTGLFFQKLGGAFALGTSTATLGGGTGGWYSYSAATANVDTAGRMRVDYNATGSAVSLAVWHEYEVIPQQVYDSLHTATDLLDVSVRQWDGATVATATGTLPNVNVVGWTGQTLATATGDVPKVNLTHIGGATLATGSAQIGVNVVNWTSQTIATSTGSYPNVNAALVNNSAPETATDIAEEVWNLDASNYQTAGTFGQAIGNPTDTNSIWSLVRTNLDDPVSGVAVDVMNQTVEGTTTLVQSARGWNAVLMGDSTGLDTGVPVYKSLSGAQDRWSGSANLGNRTTSNRDLTAT